jgi:hypothetical protein
MFRGLGCALQAPKNQLAKTMTEDFKLCPYCAEEIKEAAIVCKHCGKELPEFKQTNIGKITGNIVQTAIHTARVSLIISLGLYGIRALFILNQFNAIGGLEFRSVLFDAIASSVVTSIAISIVVFLFALPLLWLWQNQRGLAQILMFAGGLIIAYFIYNFMTTGQFLTLNPDSEGISSLASEINNSNTPKADEDYPPPVVNFTYTIPDWAPANSTEYWNAHYLAGQIAWFCGPVVNSYTSYDSGSKTYLNGIRGVIIEVAKDDQINLPIFRIELDEFPTNVRTFIRHTSFYVTNSPDICVYGIPAYQYGHGTQFQRLIVDVRDYKRAPLILLLTPTP